MQCFLRSHLIRQSQSLRQCDPQYCNVCNCWIIVGPNIAGLKQNNCAWERATFQNNLCLHPKWPPQCHSKGKVKYFPLWSVSGNQIKAANFRKTQVKVKLQSETIRSGPTQVLFFCIVTVASRLDSRTPPRSTSASGSFRRWDTPALWSPGRPQYCQDPPVSTTQHSHKIVRV